MFIYLENKDGKETYINLDYVVRIVMNDRTTNISLLDGGFVEIIGCDNETLKEILNKS